MNKFEQAARAFMVADEEMAVLKKKFAELKRIDHHEDYSDEGKRISMVCRFNRPERPEAWCEACQAFDWGAMPKARRQRQNAMNRMRRWFRNLQRRGL